MKKKDTQKLLKKIKDTRIINGYSQEAIAYELGISQNSYHKIEAGKTELKVTTLFTLVKILKINSVELF